MLPLDGLATARSVPEPLLALLLFGGDRWYET
jgi:hypothetical protein